VRYIRGARPGRPWNLCHANSVGLQPISRSDDGYTGNCPVERPTVLGLVAAAIWLVGLVVGVSALVAGDLVVAAVSVVLALVAPWLRLAWNLHARLGLTNCPSPAGVPDLRPAGFPAGLFPLIVSCAISLFPRVWIAPRWGTA
jgi:hypothetical protein